VPPGATWAELTLTAGSHTSPKLFMAHCTQLLPHKRPTQFRQALTLTSETLVCTPFEVTGGEGLEIVRALPALLGI
jgi:tripeptidyl-peptidase II